MEEEYKEKVVIDNFTTKYTTVYHTAPATYNAHHDYLVESTEEGKELGRIHFQEGPIKECEVNGINNEDLLMMVVERLSEFQASEYSCYENAAALYHINRAVGWLRMRTRRREEEGKEGTHIV